jgi:hypothetical protein
MVFLTLRTRGSILIPCFVVRFPPDARAFRSSDPARVAESVDAPALGAGRASLWGFESPLSHQEDHVEKVAA